MLERIDAARRAQTEWGGKSVRERLCRLRRLRELLTARLDEIVRVIADEIGKPPMDALAGDVMVTLEALRYHERVAERVLRSRRVDKPAFLFRGTQFSERYEPHGVVLVIAPWNYPLQLAMVPIITALTAGNAVVAKCSDRAPKTAALLADLFRVAGFGDDLVFVSCGAADEATALIAAKPDLIFFTGSSANGRRVAAQAAELLIPTILELGGKDPALVFASCDLRRAVEGLCYGAFSNAGQVCVGTKRIYVQRSVWENFLTAFIERTQTLRVGTDIESDMGIVRFDDVHARLTRQVDEALQQGAKLHTVWDRTLPLLPPLVLSGVPESSSLLREESFGPVVCLAPFDEEADAVQFANASRFALSASVFTGDAAQAERVVAALHAGSCTVNDVIRSVGNPYAAFGGNGQSGHGRYHGETGLLAFSRIKTVMRVTRPKAREIHWFPFQAKTYRAVRALLLLRHRGDSAWQRLQHVFKKGDEL